MFEEQERSLSKHLPDLGLYIYVGKILSLKL